MITVLCHGTFRLLHPGHIAHLARARAAGDKLVVSITAGKFITKPRGPLFSDEERASLLNSITFVDHVVICHGVTGAQSILSIKPNIYAKGIDYIDRTVNAKELEACQKVGASIMYTLTDKYNTGDFLK